MLNQFDNYLTTLGCRFQKNRTFTIAILLKKSYLRLWKFYRNLIHEFYQNNFVNFVGHFAEIYDFEWAHTLAS